MNSTLQIYFNSRHRKLSSVSFLATVLLLLSNFLTATTLVSQSLSDSLVVVTSDSTKLTPKSTIGVGKLQKMGMDSIRSTDSSTVLVADTLSANDTLDISGGDEIEDIIDYKAEDSIVYDMNTKKMFLYNSADVKYQKVTLQSNLIEFDWNTFTLMAVGSTDSNGVMQGNPVFSEDGKEYKASRMRYNFKTKKGIVYEVVTKEGDAYIHSERVKKNEFDEWYGEKSRYTTCDLDHPHFYFKAKKVKIVPNKVMVTGPTNLWVADVPTPLYLPFGIFPVKQGKRSGLVVPEYVTDGQFGFGLRNGGYYWAMNDYVGIKFLGQVYTNGTVGAGLNASYTLRYKFTGNLGFNWIRTRPTDPDLPRAKSTNAYSLSWTHNQDVRSIPNSNFGATVQMQSADFYQQSRVTDIRLLSTSFSSAVNFSHNFAGTPFSLSVNLRHDQNLLNRTIGFSLPTFRLSMSRVSPFKSKIVSDKPKWFENIGFTYSFEFLNRLNTYDSTLFNASTSEKFRFGFNQNVSVDAPIRAFKYLNITPAFQYQERTYFKGVDKYWNSDTTYFFRGDGSIDTLNGQIMTDTVWRFNSARNFNASLTFNTKVIGIFKFKSKNLKAIKHVFTPSIGFNYNPDFSTDFWKYYRSVQSNANGEVTRYSVFEPDAVYGIPGGGQVASLNWNLANNFEMKTFSKKDTVNHEQKVGLLDQVNFGGGYNFAADSLKLLPFNLTVVSSRIFNLINLNFSATFDPYAVDSSNRKINTFEWAKSRKLLRFATANINASTSLHSKPRMRPPAPDELPRFVGDYVSYNPNQYYDFDIPWNINLGYNFNISKGTPLNPDTVITVQSVRVSADFNLTPKWKFAISTGFDISRKQVTLTNITVVRDLHCWELSFNWTPALPTFNGQQFSIILQPKSGTLRDLKLERKNALSP